MVAVVALAAASAGFMAFQFVSANRATAAEAATETQPAAENLRGEALVGQRRPDYTLGSADGSIVSASDFDGKAVLVNFWATWCAPCREEMPMLMEVRERYHADGFEVVGIALDDVAPAREFAEELGIQYPNLVGSTDVMATIRLYGNVGGALPYSVLVDPEGIIQWVKFGVLEESELEDRIQAVLH